MQATSRPTPLEIGTRPIWFGPFLLALAAALSYTYADRKVPIPDEGALLTAAVKILRGGVFYRDIDAYAFPGVSYLLAGTMSLFGEHLAVARAVSGSLYCSMVLGVYACALALMDRKRAALCGLSLLSLKFFAYPIYTMYFYADASLTAAILALAVFLRHAFDGASKGLFCVGVLTGLSIVTKQSTGIAVAIVFTLVICFPGFAHGPRKSTGRLAELSIFGAGLCLVVGSMSAYFASQGVLGAMLQGGLVRPFTGYLPTSGVSFLPPLEWWNFGKLKTEGPVYFSQLYWELVMLRLLPGASLQGLYLGLGEWVSRMVYTSIPIVFGACAWLWIAGFRAPRSEETRTKESALAQARFFTTAGICLAITASAFPRTDFIHVITIYPAVVLVLFALGRTDRLGRGWTNQRHTAPTQPLRRLHFEVAIVASLLAISILLSLRYDTVLTHRLSTARAELWVKPANAWLGPLIRTIRRHVRDDQPLFVYGHEAQWYFLSDRYTPRSFSQLYPGMTGDETGRELAALIRETRPPLIVQGVLQWKGMPPVRAYTRELTLAIRELYVPVAHAIPRPPGPRMLRIWRLRE